MGRQYKELELNHNRLKTQEEKQVSMTNRLHEMALQMPLDDLKARHLVSINPKHVCYHHACFNCICSEVYRDLKACEEVIKDMKLDEASEYIETIGGLD